jgi:hypothetical protein
MVTRKRKKIKRFTVSVSEQDYKRLQEIAGAHRPPFTLQYVVHWGIQGILARAEDPQLMLELGNPLAKPSR